MARCATCAQDGFGFIDENERHETLFPLLARSSKDFAHHSFRFAYPHIEDLGTLHVHEIFVHLSARLGAELLRQIECSRLSNERLAAARRAVEQKTFRRSVLKFLEKIRM